MRKRVCCSLIPMEANFLHQWIVCFESLTIWRRTMLWNNRSLRSWKQINQIFTNERCKNTKASPQKYAPNTPGYRKTSQDKYCLQLKFNLLITNWPYIETTTFGRKNMRMIKKIHITVFAIHPPWCQESRLSLWSFTPIIISANIAKNKKFPKLTRRTACIWYHSFEWVSEALIPINTENEK